MKKISFKITKDINGEAIAKIKIPEKIDLDVIDVNARILSEIDGNRYLLKDSNLVEKIEDKIDIFLKKGEYIFISNGYVCIHLDNFLSAIFTLLESVDKKSINIKTLDNFMSGVIYGLDILPEEANNLIEVYCTGEEYNKNQELLFWRVLLGRIVYKNKHSIN
jgi:hypothetical protein